MYMLTTEYLERYFTGLTSLKVSIATFNWYHSESYENQNGRYSKNPLRIELEAGSWNL